EEQPTFKGAAGSLCLGEGKEGPVLALPAGDPPPLPQAPLPLFCRMVAALLREGADPNLVLPEGVAPMHLAAGLEQENGIRRLRLLLQHGGDPNVRSGEGLTPLHVAASWGCTAGLRILLAEGGDPQVEDQVGPKASLPRGWQMGEGRAVSAPPTPRKPPGNLGLCSLGGSLASARGGGREDPSSRTRSEAGSPPVGGAAQDPPEGGPLESLAARGPLGKQAEKASRVSFSRLSGRGPPAPGPPGRLSPPCQEVPLSPGGRPAPLSTTEPVEHLYVDEEGGQSLIERHLPPTDDSGAGSSEDGLRGDWQACAREAGGSGAGAPLNPEHLTDRALVHKLRELGADPGPVTPLTRRLYVRLLERLSRETAETSTYSPELASALHTYRIPSSKADELALAAEFDQPDKSRKWREGLLKSSFNYLLLDPRVTQNLPARCQLLSPAEAFQTFVRAVFYVGKGTRGRPYRHLYEALGHYWKGQGMPATQASSKVRHILEIWARGQGVVSMHCFQNVVPVEAYTREACMVDAIGELLRLGGGWPMKRRRSLGVFLLHRALQIFLAEGERQLRPTDI
uniref:Ankyrin repeat and LEM domain containing 1 n=1 Tax=Naja naja TaxID=35670 RepID=A0A8C6VC38_NAJNA